MTIKPDYVLAGYRLMEDGEVIREDCKIWSLVNGQWIDVSDAIVGRTYDKHLFVHPLSIPISPR